MSDQFLLHGPATGTMHWELSAFGKRAHLGCSDVEIDVACHRDETETFTRTSGRHRFSTRLTQSPEGTLVETFGLLSIVFEQIAGPRTALRQRRTQVLGLALPRFVLDISATIEPSKDRSAAIHSFVQISVLSILQLRYSAVLTERQTS